MTDMWADRVFTQSGHYTSSLLIMRCMILFSLPGASRVGFKKTKEFQIDVVEQVREGGLTEDQLFN
jgi:hypothetical protein